jgi:hypothetical protein
VGKNAPLSVLGVQFLYLTPAKGVGMTSSLGTTKDKEISDMKRWVVRLNTIEPAVYVRNVGERYTGVFVNDTTHDVELAHGYHYKREAAQEADTWANGRPEKYKKE